MRLSGDRLFTVMNMTLLILFSASILYPMLNMLAISLSDPLAVARGSVAVVPVDFTWAAYRIVFAANEIMTAYFNTVVYCVSATTLTLLVCSMASYPLSLPSFHPVLKSFCVVAIIIPMFINGGIIPSLLTIQLLNLYDSMWAVVLPPVVSTWYIILIRTMMRTLPGELRESATMDGAGEFRVYWQIVMPLIKPVLATIALFSTVSMWNAFFTPLIYLQDPNKYPLQIVLRRLQEGSLANIAGTSDNLAGVMQTLRSAAMVITIGPIILVYPFLQKYFVKGMLVGSLKG